MIDLLAFARSIVDQPTPDEIDRLSDIHADGFSRSWSTEDFAALLSGENVFALVARRQSIFTTTRIVGFVLVRAAADEAEILTVAVSRSHRGRGFGRLLMEEAMRRLYRERVAACFLEVNRANDSAVRLYRALGFKEVGTRKGYYDGTAGADGSALVMRLQLR